MNHVNKMSIQNIQRIRKENTMSTFSALKKSSGSIDKLARELEKLNAPATNSSEDTRFWRPELDKAGNGFATIRFLPDRKSVV